MECTFCPGHESTCHLTKVVNGKVVEVHVCEKCIPALKSGNILDTDLWEEVSKLAKKKGMPDPLQALEPEPAQEISAKSLLMPLSLSKSKTCPQCGFGSEDLRKTGKLGCPHCYEVFADMLDEVIADCQKGTQHLGKIPRALRGVRRQRLEEELEQAVRDERFEDAAVLRDQLAALGTE